MSGIKELERRHVLDQCVAEVPREGIAGAMIALQAEFARIGFEPIACVSLDASGAAMVEKCGPQGATLYDSSPPREKMVYRESHTMFVDAKGRFYLFTLA